MSLLLKSRLILLLCYSVSAIASWILAGLIPEEQPVLQMAGAMLILACLVFCFSFIFNNSSLFDPYWSVMPLFIFFFLLWHTSVRWYFADSGDAWFQGRWYGMIRFVFLLSMISWWGTRLTWNFLRNWKGLGHEDWRYRQIRDKWGRAYWFVSFLGIHLFPAILVFLGSLSIWVVLSNGIRPAGIPDLLALILTGFAIWLETRADRQLYDHVRNFHEHGIIMKNGLWSVSRHPNYLGEISFWWGIYFFALTANPSFWWVVCGPVGITLMFVFISIPMIEKRMMKRYSEYPEYQKNVSMLIPWKSS